GYFTIAYEDEATTGVTGTVVKSDTFKFTVGPSINSIPSLLSNSLPQPVLIGGIIGFLAIAGILFVLFRRKRNKA
ncbi:MAG: LPXTG cell wall anchor domain-containing protein, partial [Methanosarcinales archaeon]|nr:LPXTG cell wall anchor domain-containing protein [Methanosarcinales archaeon]